MKFSEASAREVFLFPQTISALRQAAKSRRNRGENSSPGLKFIYKTAGAFRDLRDFPPLCRVKSIKLTFLYFFSENVKRYRNFEYFCFAIFDNEFFAFGKKWKSIDFLRRKFSIIKGRIYYVRIVL